MPLKTDISGMVYRYPDYFAVGREQVRTYASAVKSEDPASYHEDAAAELGYDNIVAPLTFVSIIAKIVQADFFRNVDTGYEMLQIVQVDQKFIYHRPVFAGDKLWATMEVTSVEQRFGADIVVTENRLTTDDDELVLTAYTTMMGHEGDKSIQLKWDLESGQVVRTG